MKKFQILSIFFYCIHHSLHDHISYTEHIFSHLDTQQQLSDAIQTNGFLVVNFYNDSDISSHIWEVKFRKLITTLDLPLEHIYEVNCSASELCLHHNIHTFPVVFLFNKYKTYKIIPKKKKTFKKLISNIFSFNFKRIKDEKEFKNDTTKLIDKVLIKVNVELGEKESKELINVFRLNSGTEVFLFENLSTPSEDEFIALNFVRITDLNRYDFEVKISIDFVNNRKHFEKISNLLTLKLKSFSLFELDDLLHKKKPVVIIYLKHDSEAIKEEAEIFTLLKENIEYFYIVKNSFNSAFIESHSLNEENKYLLFINGKKYKPKTSKLPNVVSLQNELMEEIFVNSPLETKDGLFHKGDYRHGFEELNKLRLDDFLHSNESGIVVSYLGDLENDTYFIQKVIEEIVKEFKYFKKGIIDKGLNDHKIIKKTTPLELIGFINKDKINVKRVDVDEKEYKKQIKELNEWFKENKKDNDDEEDL